MAKWMLVGCALLLAVTLQATPVRQSEMPVWGTIRDTNWYASWYTIAVPMHVAGLESRQLKADGPGELSLPVFRRDVEEAKTHVDGLAWIGFGLVLFRWLQPLFRPRRLAS